MKNKTTNLIFLMLGGAILIFLLWDFGFENIWSNVHKIGWWLAPITGIWLIIYILNAQAWKVIIGKDNTVNFFRLLSLKITGFSINYLTPVVGLAGEPWKILNIKNEIGVEKASSSIILYNMMHILSHFYFWVTAVILFLVTNIPEVVTTLVLGFVLAILVSLIAVFYIWHSKGVVYSLLRFLRVIPGLKGLVIKIESKEDSLKNIENQVIELYTHRRKSFYLSLSLEYIARLVASLEFYFIMRAISVDISILEALYINAASSLLANLFFFIPLQLGTREGSLYIVYESLKYTPALGVFVSLVTRIREFFWIFIGLILLKIGTPAQYRTK
ncbi:MAG: hypothetical protein A2X11_12350 [Bacteroidetes bacterium GWE2_42_24]|nr:MAG: hypothetical protein A2X11_12350 [Bacteroidetes bacterium GWE2_42_24]OFY30641.1 MAG: hypothetical protein A2X09_03595 [Bacteroidetes bacterium GWF2_43_11]